jgi:hypothetical protein
MCINKKWRSLIAIILIILCLGCDKRDDPLGAVNEAPVDLELVSKNPALAMVERFNMGSNLEFMAVQVAVKTVTFTMVVKKHGASDAAFVLKQKIKDVIPLYQDQWNQNLAKAYAKHLTPDELRALALDGKGSPHVKKLLVVQSATGEDMQKISTSILTDLVTKALTNALE